MKTIKIIGIVAAAVLVIWGLASWGGNKPMTTTEPDKMGVIAPLSSDFSAIGEELKRGIDLAVEQLKSHGTNISVMYEDDMFDPKQAATAAQKLINIDKVNLVVLFSVEEATPVIPIFENNKVPLVVLWDSNAFLKDAGDYVFSNGFSTEKAGQLMADFASSTLKLKRVAVISHIDAWSEIISQAFADQFKSNGGEVIYTDAVQVGTSDFRLTVTKLKSAKPDSVYVPLIPFDSVSFIKQAKELGLNVPIMSGDALIQDVIDASGDASKNIYFTNAYSDNLELINDLYTEKYGKEMSAPVYVASAFDGVIKIGQGLAGSKNIKVALDSVFGPTRSADRIEKIYQVKDGVPVEVK